MPFLVKGIFISGEFSDLWKVKRMDNIAVVVLKDVGLHRWPPFIKDRYYWLALLAGVAAFLIVWLTVAPTFSVTGRSISEVILAGIFYYPLLEEILFRGIIQGGLSKKAWGKKTYLHLTIANLLTSVLFTAAHIWYQPVLWALMLIVPSMIFGFFRDRYGSIYPSIGLHMFYNAGFIFVNLAVQ